MMRWTSGERRRWRARPAITTLLHAAGMGVLALALVPAFAGPGPRLLVAVAGGAGAALVLSRPDWGVLLLWAVSFVQVPVVPYLLSAVLLAAAGLSVLRERSIWVLRVPQVRILLAIGVLLLVSVWWNEYVFPQPVLPELDETRDELRIFTARLVCLVVSLWFLGTRRGVERLVWLVLALMLGAVASAAPSLVSGGPERVQASFSLARNSNRLALIALLAASLLWFYRATGRSRLARALATPLLPVLPIAALASGSRGGLVELLLLGAMVLWYERHGSPARWVGTAAVAGVGALLLASLVPHAMFLRATTFDPAVVGRGQDSLRNRLHTAVVGVRMAAEHPWLGVGIGNFVGLKRAYYGLPREQHVHNAYLWAVTSGGAGVLGLYLLLIGVAFRMLGVLERAGPREWIWLTRATRVNLVLFLTASAFADIWLNELFYLLVGLPAMMLTVAARTRAAHRVPTGMPARAAAAAPAPASGAA